MSGVVGVGRGAGGPEPERHASERIVVQVIERQELAKGQDCLEVHVYRLPGNPSVVVAKTIYGEPLGYGHRWHMSRLDIPVAEAFLGAIRQAEGRGIPFVWVNDPHRLFPADKRPAPSLAGATDASPAETGPARPLRSAEGGAPPEGVPFMITQLQKEQLRQLGYDEDQIRNMAPAEAHRILGVSD